MNSKMIVACNPQIRQQQHQDEEEQDEIGNHHEQQKNDEQRYQYEESVVISRSLLSKRRRQKRSSSPSSLFLSSSSLFLMLMLSTVFLLCVNVATCLSTDFVFQSGPDHGNTYASSIQYDSLTNHLYMTGSTYGSFWNYYDGDDDNDSVNDRIYSSACFLAILDWDTGKWTTKTFVNDEGVPESCKQILVMPKTKKDDNSLNHDAVKVLLIGNTQDNGILDTLHVRGTTFDSYSYGMMLDVDVHFFPENDDGQTTKMKFLGGRLLQDGPVQYPMGITMATTPTSTSTNPDVYEDLDGLTFTGGDVFVVSLQSYDSHENHQHVNDAAVDDDINEDPTASLPASEHSPEEQLVDQMEPNLNAVLQYGSKYSMLVERFFSSYDINDEDDITASDIDMDNDDAFTNNDTNIEETWIDTWRKPYSATNSVGQQTMVHVAGVTTYGNDNSLVVMGSTAGIGSIFGQRKMTNNTDHKNVDGFITLLAEYDGNHKNQTLRIESMDNKDDFITGYCQRDHDLYVVGTTYGQIDTSIDTFVQGEIHAFIIAIDLLTFKLNWIKQIGGEALNLDEVHGISCDVTSDGQTLYFGGNVKNGGSLSLYGEETNGGDDIFIIQLSTANGRMNYIRQWGTSKNDELTDITTDTDGNAIVLGNTNGSILRSKRAQTIIDDVAVDTTDVFILIMTRETGQLQKPMDQYSAAGIGSTVTGSGAVAGTATPPVTGTVAGPPKSNNDKDGTATATTTITDTKDDTATKDTTSTTSTENNTIRPPPPTEVKRRTPSFHVYSIILFIFFFIALIMLCVTKQYWMPRQEISTDRSQVLKYLHDFDIDDIDLKHSATGGWHGNYNNDLAEGINSRNPGHAGSVFANWRAPTSHRYEPSVTPDDNDLGNMNMYCDNPVPKTSSTSTTTTQQTDALLANRDDHIDSLFTSKNSKGINDDSSGGVHVKDAGYDDYENASKPWTSDLNDQDKQQPAQETGTRGKTTPWGTDII